MYSNIGVGVFKNVYSCYGIENYPYILPGTYEGNSLILTFKLSISNNNTALFDLFIDTRLKVIQMLK